ncbi:MAG: outer membrane lipoprotein-sorting protein [Candidatus Omnitrophica bacterium]|nr:outer membrane lipoprotein-sorting protein [Candidatus Omnitrophota bacterium]
MKKGIFLIICLFFLILPSEVESLEYHRLYNLKEGMNADEIMKTVYHNKYSLFCKDITLKGKVIYIDSPNFFRKRKYIKYRMISGKDGIAYKEITTFTYPTEVKGLSLLVWSYESPQKKQDVWLWVPSLKKVRKISPSQNDDAFMGSDFTVEEVSTRKFEDETYRLIGEKSFAGYKSKYTGKDFFKGRSCFVIEAVPKKKNWYYAKRIIWVDKETGGNIYEEYYDRKGRLFKTIFRKWELLDAGDKKYPTQTTLEVTNLISKHSTVILMDNIRYDQNLSSGLFTVKTLMRSRW